MAINSIIIVGAGPSGLLLTLLLARLTSIPSITVLERDASPTNETRAVFYQPVAFYEFKRAGIFDAVDKVALKPNKAVWRDMTGKSLFDMITGRGMLALTMNLLAGIAADELQSTPRVQLKWSHEVVSLGEADGVAWVHVKTGTAQHRLQADYVVGCDGGGSTVRRCLFGENSMPGFTWDKNLVAADARVAPPMIL